MSPACRLAVFSHAMRRGAQWATSLFLVKESFEKRIYRLAVYQSNNPRNLSMIGKVTGGVIKATLLPYAPASLDFRRRSPHTQTPFRFDIMVAYRKASSAK